MVGVVYEWMSVDIYILLFVYFRIRNLISIYPQTHKRRLVLTLVLFSPTFCHKELTPLKREGNGDVLGVSEKSPVLISLQ